MREPPTSVPQRLDEKLTAVRANPHTSAALIVADAKDPDMAFGCAAPGRRRDGTLKPRVALLDAIRTGLVDLMLMSGSSVEKLVVQEGLPRGSAVTPAGRINDSTDI